MKSESNLQIESFDKSQTDTSTEQPQQSTPSSAETELTNNQTVSTTKETKIRETKVYDEGYVKSLREESAVYRVRAKSAEEKAAELEKQLVVVKESARTASLKSRVGLAARDLKIIDADAALLLLEKDTLTFNEETNEYEGIEDALKKLVEAKPYLVGNVLQSATKPTNPPRKPVDSPSKDLKSALTAYYKK